MHSLSSPGWPWISSSPLISASQVPVLLVCTKLWDIYVMKKNLKKHYKKTRREYVSSLTKAEQWPRWPAVQWTSILPWGRGLLTSFCRLESCEERLSILMRLSISSSLALFTVEVFISEDSLAFSSCKSRKASVLINKWGSRTDQDTSNLSPAGNWLTKQENHDWSADAITRHRSFHTRF